MTCGPSEETQAMHSWAAVTFFFFAMPVKASTIAKLCLIDYNKGEFQKRSMFDPRYKLLRLLGTEADGDGNRPLHDDSISLSCIERSESLARDIFRSFDLTCQETSSEGAAEEKGSRTRI